MSRTRTIIHQLTPLGIQQWNTRNALFSKSIIRDIESPSPQLLEIEEMDSIIIYDNKIDDDLVEVNRDIKIGNGIYHILGACYQFPQHIWVYQM